MFFFDGFDEVKREKSELLARQIQELGTKYPDNYYIVSSRPSDEFMGWNDFCELKSNFLSKKQAISLIKKLDFDENVKRLFCKELEDTLYDRYKSFASNPLLLTIMLLTFDNGASIPNKLNDFYEQAFVTLFNLHDATKDTFKREIRTKLGCEDFKLVFAYFCFKSYFNCEYEFSEPRLREYIQTARDKFNTINFRVDDFQDDLLTSVCMLVKDGLNYFFSHRSFQEYFAAWYTTKLPDSIQKQLIKSWLIEKKGFAFDAYFSMLYNMQANKFDKLILEPGLKEVKKKYQKEKFGFKFVSDLFSSIIVKIVDDKMALSLVVRDNYLCSVLRMTCLYHRYTKSLKSEKSSEFLEYVLKKVPGQDPVVKNIKLKDIEKDGMTEAFLKEISWVKEEIEFSIKYLNRIRKENTIGRGKTVESILENI